MKKLRIDATFKTFGAFWDYKQQDNKSTGSISSRKGTVEFDGSPEYIEGDAEAMKAIFAEINALPDLQGSSSICGFTTMNRCTLLNPIRLSGDGLADFPTMQKVNRIRYRAMRTVMGLHLESSGANVLDSAAVYLTKIHHLLPSPWSTKLSENKTCIPNNDHSS
jgi:hypothetical protein